MYPSVRFQRASSNLETFSTVKKSDISWNDNKGGLSGTEAKEFYESLLKETNETCVKNVKRKYEADIDVGKRCKRNATGAIRRTASNETEQNVSDGYTTRQVNSFLKMAQEGDISGLERTIQDRKVDINVKDQFGWTALMCAAKSGHRACVKLLLSEGADLKLQNTKGETARDIAKHSGVHGMFDHQRKSREKQKSDYNSEFTTSIEQTCSICGTTYFGSKNKHDTSTAHLFNCQYKSERTLYHIPETNIGFKLMKQKGWDQEQGLGPEGAGRKFPVKTILKQDRQGLGSKKEKAKITHFSARDTNAVEGERDVGVSKQGLRAPRRTWKRNLFKKQKKDKRWEQNLRVYMNTD